MKDYSDKLKDPRWQRRRLEILQRDEFKCQICGAQQDQLHVHHHYYERGREPWDYPEDNFITLCLPCHDRVEAQLSEIRRHAAPHRERVLEIVQELVKCDGCGRSILPSEVAGTDDERGREARQPLCGECV